MARRLPSILTVAAAAPLVASFVATTAAQAHPAPNARGVQRPAQARAVRVVSKYATSANLPKSVKHARAGAVNLGEDGTLQRYVNRSNSPRPSTVQRHGVRMLANSASDSWL